jgi:hypothetical protein
LDEPVSLRRIEPLHHTLFSSQRSYSSASDVPIRVLVTLVGATSKPATHRIRTSQGGYKTSSAAGFWHKPNSVSRLWESE